MKYSIHLFKKDLRLSCNSSIQDMIKEHDGCVLFVYCIDPKEFKNKDFSNERFYFLLETLHELKKEIKEAGGELIVVESSDLDFLQNVFNFLKKEKINLPSSISWNKEWEPRFIRWEEEINKFLKKEKVAVHIRQDRLLILPEELKKDDGGTYQVFTPFSRKWLELFERKYFNHRVLVWDKEFKKISNFNKDKGIKTINIKWSALSLDDSLIDDILLKYLDNYKSKKEIILPKAGTKSAYQALVVFKDKLNQYGADRDCPSLEGTSRLSHYLNIGSLSVAQVIGFLDLTSYSKKIKGQDHFLAELIWREFYTHILFHHARIEKEAFIVKFNDIKWENSKALFNKWKNGETGYPIVDAGMRQLNQTGWMHNRVRMIVASFLTKDLLIDWRWGEAYFMQKLIDGDLAANNGGWQWSASTGVDPSPYFRIFNPWLQGEKFDKEGKYIKTYIPELKNVSSALLHKPSDQLSKVYLKPIVEHNVQRAKALNLYSNLK